MCNSMASACWAKDTVFATELALGISPPPALRTKMSGMHKVQCGNEVEHARAPVNVSFLNGLHVTNKEEHQSNPSYRRYLNLF